MNRIYKTRTAVVFLFFCFFYLIIIGNLFFIQIKNKSFFTQLGEKQYKVTITTTPPRAPIYDRSGKQFLAMNKDSVSAFVLPKVLTQPRELNDFLKRYFPGAYTRLAQNRNNNFMYIARRLTEEQINLIKNSGITDIQFLNEPSRFYPIESAGHILGITDIDNKGLFGLELFCNKKLAGKPTIRSLHKDARSGHFYFDKETKMSGEQGIALVTTLDSDLQFLAHEELKKSMAECQAKEGAVIIMNPKNGEILAMANLPTFNPNETRDLDLEFTKNKVITEAYELGSVIKVLATLASLEEGVVTADQLIDCEGVKTAYVDGRKINTVPSSVDGIIPFSRVIEKSNNIGIAKVVKNLGPKLYDHYCKMGFGKKTNIEFPSEHTGFVNHPSHWSKQSIFSLSYGYEISATLLQLARAFCIIANGGYAIQPTLIVSSSATLSDQQPLYSKETIETLKIILENTVHQGSAQKARINGYRIMGKTGTANLLIDGQYSPTKNIYTFAGIVERNNYQRVIVTFINEVPKKGVYASTIAAPLFERIAERTLIHDKII